MRQRADARLHQEPVVAEELVLEEDLLDHLLRAADDERTPPRAERVEVLALHGRPASLAADCRHHLRVAGKELTGIADVAVRVDAERGPAVTCGLRRLTVHVCKWNEA